MIAIHQDLVTAIIEKFSIEINQQKVNAISKLNAISTTGLEEVEITYLNWVKEEFNNIDFLKLKPNEMEKYIKHSSFKSVPIINSYENGKEKQKKSMVKNLILDALDYKGLRSAFYPAYFQEIGIKACVYCNSSLTVAVDRIDNDGKDEVRAKFQVDHFYPKSDFPMFSITLFNLYPSCASCNNVKNDKMVSFYLYSTDIEEINQSRFQFKLSSYNEAKYLLHRHSKEIDFDFIEDKNLQNGYFTFQDTFDIKGIYNTQKDLIADLVDKSLVYDFHYKKSLNMNFPKLFLSKEHFDRFILGNYPRVQDIHKRPMSKFIQDIAKDLGIID